MRNLIFGEWPSTRASVGLLAIRLSGGLGLALHGLPKIYNPLGWMGADATVPAVFQLCSALAEFGGGIAWIVGLLVPLVSLAVVINMFVAILTVVVPMKWPFVAAPGKPAGELAWIYLSIAILLFTCGAGRLSLDFALFGRRDGKSPA
jgi:putative oxidoreductase